MNPNRRPFTVRPGRHPHAPARPTCSTCGAEIIFVRSAKTGTPIPCNPKPVVVPTPEEVQATGVPPPARLLVRDEHGFGVVVKNPPPNSVGFVTHFATCPDARRHRRQKSTQARPGPRPGVQLLLF